MNSIMGINFLVSGSEESFLIYEELKKKIEVSGMNFLIKNLNNPMYIEQYIHDNKILPLLICGSGTEHGETHNLSLKIKKYYDEIGYDKSDLVKIVFDQHLDNMMGIAPCATHIGDTRSEKIYSKIYNIDCKGGCSWSFEELTRAKFGSKEDPSLSGELKGKKIHISVDMDISYGDYIDIYYKKGFVDLSDLLDSISELVGSNDVVAFDICGVAPFNAHDSETRYRLVNGKWKKHPTGQINPIKGDDDQEYIIGLEPKEKKEMAPSFHVGVEHYFRIIRKIADEYIPN